MRYAVLAAATLLVATPAAADPLERLRNASANELCWDTTRNYAREKYPTVRLGDAAAIQASLTTTVQRSGRESRKAFPGIRTC